jgi:hypothetical protein
MISTLFALKTGNKLSEGVLKCPSASTK